jgi:hypothetical protein
MLKEMGNIKEDKKMAEQKRIWDNFKEIGEVRKSDSIKFVIAAAIRDGVKYINIREFYKRKRDEVWMPSKDGITIPLVVPVNNGADRLTPYSKMVELISKAATELETMELADEAHAVYITKKEK